MPVPRASRIDLTGPTLLLSHEPEAQVDVVLVDLTTLAVDQVGAAVAAARPAGSGGVGVVGGGGAAVRAAIEAGADLAVVDLADASTPDVRAVVGSGVVVVLHHAVPTVAVAAVDRLAADGVDTGRVVVELGAPPDLFDELAALERAAPGYRVGVRLVPDLAPAGHGAVAEGHEAAAGREIGVLTALLNAGVATVRGADPRRFRRVRAVLEAIDAAVEAPPVDPVPDHLQVPTVDDARGAVAP